MGDSAGVCRAEPERAQCLGAARLVLEEAGSGVEDLVGRVVAGHASAQRGVRGRNYLEAGHRPEVGEHGAEEERLRAIFSGRDDEVREEVQLPWLSASIKR